MERQAVRQQAEPRSCWSTERLEPRERPEPLARPEPRHWRSHRNRRQDRKRRCNHEGTGGKPGSGRCNYGHRREDRKQQRTGNRRHPGNCGVTVLGGTPGIVATQEPAV